MRNFFSNNISDRRKNIEKVVAEILYIFTIPILLLKLHLISLDWRFFILTVCSFCVLAIMHHEKWSAKKIGLTHDYRLKPILAYGIFAILGTIFLILLAKKLHFHAMDVDDFWISWRLIVFFIPVSILQEVVYRGFLMTRLHEVIKDRNAVVFINAILFTLLHTIYPKPEIMLSIAFGSGIIMAYLYEKYPNIVLISLAHAILNFVAVLFGFFTA